jgi:hypothetical protein
MRSPHKRRIDLGLERGKPGALHGGSLYTGSEMVRLPNTAATKVTVAFAHRIITGPFLAQVGVSCNGDFREFGRKRARQAENRPLNPDKTRSIGGPMLADP